MGEEVLAEAILDSLPGTSVVAFDRAFRVIACAGEPLASRGLDRTIVVGQRLPEQLGTAVFAVYGPHYVRALAGEASSLETDTVDHDRIYATEFSPLREPDGTVRGGIAVSRDVTGARRAQIALATSERHLRELADESTDAQARLRPDGEFLFVSRAAGRLIGYSCEELRGTNFTSWCTGMTSQGSPSVVRSWPTLRAWYDSRHGYVIATDRGDCVRRRAIWCGIPTATE